MFHADGKLKVVNKESHMSQDQLHRYVFDKRQVRGELVQLNDTLDQVFENHQYPQPVKQLLAELMVATALLTATLKFEGDISVQIQGDGPVAYAVVNANNNLELRGLARLQGEITATDLHSLIGKGHMVITINPKKGERYQGIVPLEGDTLAQCLEGYFRQSEQLTTRLWFATDLSDKHNKASGLFLQVLPVNKAQSQEDFLHLFALSSTVKDQELLELDPTTLLTRLYHEDNPKVFDPQTITFKCGCSREKTTIALRQMTKGELLAQIEQQGPIEVDCQFCKKQYHFNAADVEQLFTE
ncbi:MAG: molecular chaperone Hsp33 [Alteromonadaceae bacterium]|jgi:molecular chaperone Hsp33